MLSDLFAAYTACIRDSRCYSVGPTTPEIGPFRRGISIPSNKWPHVSQPPNGISIGSAGFAGLTHVPDRQTDRYADHTTCDICRNRSHLHNACDVAWSRLVR